MSSLFYQLLLATSRRNWFYITLTVNYLANTPHHSLLLPNFSLIPPYSQFQHLSSKAGPRASCPEQQGYTSYKLPQQNNPVHQSAFHSISPRRRQALMLATGGKQFHFDTSKQNSVPATVSLMGQMPKLHQILSDLLTFLFTIMSFPTFFCDTAACGSCSDASLLQETETGDTFQDSQLVQDGSKADTPPQPREQNILTAAFPACSHTAPNTKASKHAGTGR